MKPYHARKHYRKSNSNLNGGRKRGTLSKGRASGEFGKHVVNVKNHFRLFEDNLLTEANCQFSFIRAPEPQKADRSPGRPEDGGLPLAAMTFKLFVKSRAGERNADEVGSRLRVVALSRGKFSEVRAR